jgi:hypothetical protein
MWQASDIYKQVFQPLPSHKYYLHLEGKKKGKAKAIPVRGLEGP